ncbi:hypothetical protein [Streptomyces sp. NPDC006368]|uniref:hypothetical protein n=1 Tax=Streptomyces sp. NPDC006368 TaxID=3156760 RepID=UPI0033B7FBC3
MGKSKVFFYTCNRYALYNWSGEGYHTNVQTGGATAYFYGASGQVPAAHPAMSGSRVDWNPVWSIRNC